MLVFFVLGECLLFVHMSVFVSIDDNITNITTFFVNEDNDDDDTYPGNRKKVSKLPHHFSIMGNKNRIRLKQQTLGNNDYIYSLWLRLLANVEER